MTQESVLDAPLGIAYLDVVQGLEAREHLEFAAPRFQVAVDLGAGRAGRRAEILRHLLLERAAAGRDREPGRDAGRQHDDRQQRHGYAGEHLAPRRTGLRR